MVKARTVGVSRCSDNTRRVAKFDYFSVVSAVDEYFSGACSGAGVKFRVAVSDEASRKHGGQSTLDWTARHGWNSSKLVEVASFIPSIVLFKVAGRRQSSPSLLHTSTQHCFCCLPLRRSFVGRAPFHHTGLIQAHTISAGNITNCVSLKIICASLGAKLFIFKNHLR